MLLGKKIGSCWRWVWFRWRYFCLCDIVVSRFTIYAFSPCRILLTSKIGFINWNRKPFLFGQSREQKECERLYFVTFRGLFLSDSSIQFKQFCWNQWNWHDFQQQQNLLIKLTFPRAKIELRHILGIFSLTLLFFLLMAYLRKEFCRPNRQILVKYAIYAQNAQKNGAFQWIYWKFNFLT